MKIIFSLCLCLLLPQALAAEPLFITFNEMIAQCQTIAIVEFAGWEGTAQTAFDVFQYRLQVEKVLWGTPPPQPSRWLVNRAQGAVTLDKGTRCIAFINKEGGFEWVAKTMLPNQSLEQGLLFIEGFYDFNAYLVSPATLSLANLQQYIQQKEYQGHISGYLHCFSNTTLQMEPTPLGFDIHYTYRADGSISTDIQTIGYQWTYFTEKPSMSLPAWDGDMSLVFESNLVRPLQFRAYLQQLLPDGSIQSAFWLEHPEELTWEEWLEYEKNDRLGPPYYELELQAEGKKYRLVMNEEQGLGCYLEGFRGQTLYYSSIDERDTRQIVFPFQDGELVILMEPSRIPPPQLQYTRERLVRELKIQPIRARLLFRRNEKDQFLAPCTLHYRATRFCKHLNYRGK